MRASPDRLYQLLPAIYRIRDHERGEPLRALLQVIAEQVNLVEGDVGRLYENWFIETCEDWVVPYLGELVGWEGVHDAGEPGDVTDTCGRARNRILMPRREVANTIGHRRRKGTLALLELLARDVAGWPARVVEFYGVTAATQALDYQRSGRGRLVDVRQGDVLDRVSGSFDELAHTVDTRSMTSGPRQGSYNLPSVGLYVWRLRAYSVTNAPAYCREDVGANCFTFSALGNDAPLFTRPAREPEASGIAGELNVPAPIRRRAFEERVRVGDAQRRQASGSYYGVLGDGSRTANSVAVWAPDWPEKGGDPAVPVPRERVIPADLTSWAYVPPRGYLALDPMLGRIAFPPRQLPKEGVRVSYHYGFSADLGGGEYQRPISQPDGSRTIQVANEGALRRALMTWQQGEDASDANQVHTVIEIQDSGVYVLPIDVSLAAGHSLQIRAAQRRRPVIQLIDWRTEQPDSMTITGAPGSRFTLDGLLIAGRGMRVDGKLASVMVRHSTLVPGWSLDPDCEPRRPAEPSIELVDTSACLVIDHSIVGSIQVNQDEVAAEPLIIRIADSIIDATGTDCDSPECEAIGAAGSARAHATLAIARSTIIGRVMTHAIRIAENSIFMGCVTVARSQIGCIRFSYVTANSRTPRRFRCQPDLAEAAVADAIRAQRPALPIDTLDTATAAARRDERVRVRPRFNGMRYGMPTYCQLAENCADEIVRGADDEAEMGAFHDLFQPQRAANLRVRLDEYAPAASDTAIIFAT
jgi:hypothetical protein